MKIRKIINSKLSYAIYIVLVAFLFTSCGFTTAERFKDLEAPIVLVAKSTGGTVILVDKNNKYLTIPEKYYMADAIFNSYNEGDTLYCN